MADYPKTARELLDRLDDVLPLDSAEQDLVEDVLQPVYDELAAQAGRIAELEAEKRQLLVFAKTAQLSKCCATSGAARRIVRQMTQGGSP